MRRTRRKLYGKSRRRQRGKGLGKAICAGALIMALHMAPAAAKDPTFYELAHKYATEGGWENSNNLALFLTKPSNYIPPSVSSLFQYNTDSGEVEATSCALPTGIDEQQVLKPYVLESGKRYSVKIKEQLPNEAADIREGSTLIFKAVTGGEDDDGNPIVLYEVQRASDVDDRTSAAADRSYTIPANSVELVPLGGGRKQRRKTLRRKK